MSLNDKKLGLKKLPLPLIPIITDYKGHYCLEKRHVNTLCFNLSNPWLKILGNSFTFIPFSSKPFMRGFRREEVLGVLKMYLPYAKCVAFLGVLQLS